MCVCVCVVFFVFLLSSAYLKTGFNFAIIILILPLYITPHTLHSRNNVGISIEM